MSTPSSHAKGMCSSMLLFPWLGFIFITYFPCFQASMVFSYSSCGSWLASHMHIIQKDKEWGLDAKCPQYAHKFKVLVPGGWHCWEDYGAFSRWRLAGGCMSLGGGSVLRFYCLGSLLCLLGTDVL